MLQRKRKGSLRFASATIIWLARMASVGACLLFSAELQAADPAPMTLTFTVTTVASTCDLTLDNGGTIGSVVMPSVLGTAFSSASTPTQPGGSFTLKLSGCAGQAAAGQTPTISVYGDQVGVTGDKLFRSVSSEVANVGIAVWYQADASRLTGPTGNRVVATSDAANPTRLASTWSDQTAMEGKSMAFWAGVSQDGLNTPGLPNAGKVAATLHFNFAYR